MPKRRNTRDRLSAANLPGQTLTNGFRDQVDRRRRDEDEERVARRMCGNGDNDRTEQGV